eukprot:227792-Rhodomonas_salina.2
MHKPASDSMFACMDCERGLDVVVESRRKMWGGWRAREAGWALHKTMSLRTHRNKNTNTTTNHNTHNTTHKTMDNTTALHTNRHADLLNPHPSTARRRKTQQRKGKRSETALNEAEAAEDHVLADPEQPQQQQQQHGPRQQETQI